LRVRVGTFFPAAEIGARLYKKMGNSRIAASYIIHATL